MPASSALDKDQDRSRSFGRRAFIVGAAQGLFLTVLGGRLAWLQLVEGGRYKTMAERNRINMKLVAPSRGEIVDRFGVPLAVNEQNFRVLMVPEQTEDVEGALRKLAHYIDLPEEVIESVLAQAKKSASFIPIEVVDTLDWEDVATIEVHLSDLPGLSTDAGEIRNYPFGEATAHLIGYTGAVNAAEMEEDDPTLKLPGFRIGKTGIEKKFDPDLRGKSGTSEMEVNVVGREVRQLNYIREREGRRLILGIDAELQFYTQQRLQETRSASAVIMDVHTGCVYALVSYPSFNPNEFTRGINARQWEELLAMPGYPLTNKAIAGQYPPGSTFKMVTALALLEAGAARPQTIVRCPGHFELGRDRFHCWKGGGHGPMNLISALAQSCDTYFYKLSLEIGIEKIAAMAHRLGLGETYGFDLPEERSGLIPDAGWKFGRYGEKWQPGETVVASIGQGYILTTPMQLAVMTARLVNGGYGVKPWVVGYDGAYNMHEQTWPSLGFDSAHLDLVKRGMTEVVNGKKGTALGSRITEEGMEMGGKTGTAQVKRITKRERALGIKNEELAWKYRHHALFVGYAPVRNPRYVCSVVIEHGGGGSAAAAPVARDLLLMTQKRNPAGQDMIVPEKDDSAPYVPPRKPHLLGGE